MMASRSNAAFLTKCAASAATLLLVVAPLPAQVVSDVVVRTRAVQTTGAGQDRSVVVRSDGGEIMFERMAAAGLDARAAEELLARRAAASVAPVVIRSMPFAAPIPAPLYYLDGVRVSAEQGQAVPAGDIAMVQVTQPVGPAVARSIIRITSVKEADKALAAVSGGAAASAASIAGAPQAALYTSIARVVAGTDSVRPVDAIFIGRLSTGVVAPVVAPAAAWRAVAPDGAFQVEMRVPPPDGDLESHAAVDAKSDAAGTEVMYIVDGVIQMGGDPRAWLDASTISSVEVVRGAAASALYGKRAAGGVVNITTKR